VRLARNLLHYPFPHRASEAQLQAIAQRLRDALSAAGLTQAIDLSGLSLQERARLVGARIISPALLQAQAHRWALLNADGSVVAAINEEDHLRLQITCAGWQPDRLQRELIRWERTLNAMPLVWARAPKWGYLTASPINLGSGLRLGLLLHLMGLQRARQITRWLEALQALGCHTRGLYGEGSLAFEGYVQISMLGRRDPLDELLARLRGTLRTLIDAERTAREQIDRTALEEEWGELQAILRHAESLSLGTTLRALAVYRMRGMLDENAARRDAADQMLFEAAVYPRPNPNMPPLNAPVGCATGCGARAGRIAPMRLGIFKDWLNKVGQVFTRRGIDEELLEELEETLITADVNVNAAQEMLETLRAEAKAQRLREADDVRACLRELLKGWLGDPRR
jgi:protein arginine kinase